MLSNYIKYALRYLRKNKVFSIINIGGLTVGLASCLLILNYVQYEFSYDNFIKDKDNVYRVNLIRKNTDHKAAAIGPPMGAAMQQEFPEVASFVRLRHADRVLVRIGKEEFYEDKVFYVDSSFFDIFPFPMALGSPEKALTQKNSVVISKQLADKYFKDQDPIGQLIKLEDQLELKVTGVTTEPSSPHHFHYQMLISFSTFEVPFGYPVTLDTWGWTSFPTYVKLKNHTDYQTVNNRFEDFISRHMGAETAQRLDMELQPVSRIHLYSQEIVERDGIPNKGDIKYVSVLIAIAVLILGLAVFNFTNLSTTLSLKRVKEVGVRKTLGAHRKTVFWQYCVESMLIALVSMLLAITCLEIFSRQLSTIFQAPLNIIQNIIINWPYIIGLIVLVGIAGGAYPAFFLSKYSPVKALKNKVVNNNRFFSLKSLLVGLQFFITIGLVVGSVVINSQMRYMREKDLGFNKEHVIALQMQGEALTATYSLTRQRLLQNKYVQSVTSSGNLFDGQNGSVPIQERHNDESRSRISLFSGNYDFVKTLGLELMEGRDFSEEYANDSNAFILNEAAVKMFGWTDSALGKELTLNDVWEGEVIGVVKDFNFASLHEKISPLIMFLPRTHDNIIYVKTSAGNTDEILASLQQEWKTIHPELPFDYTFLDSHINTLYQADRQFSKLVYSFSILAICLACLGLYGMIAFNIDSRQKEIGIRKILGASMRSVLTILTQRYVFLILISAFVAVPVAWYVLKNWLGDFAYRIDLSPMHFVAAIVITLVIALLTLSAKTIKAVQSNPVDALKED